MKQFLMISAIILFANLASAGDLIQAIKAKDIQSIKKEVSKDNVNRSDKHGITPLILAASDGQYEICQVLLDAGADAAQKDREGFTALDHVDVLLRVASDDHQRGLAMLQRAGITNVSTMPAERIKSIDTNALVLVRALLITHGGQPSTDSISKPVGTNQWSDDQETIARLIASGFDVNSSKGDGVTPLMHAAAEGNFELCKFLVEHGANIEAVDNMGRRVRDYVCIKKGDLATKNRIDEFLDKVQK